MIKKLSILLFIFFFTNTKVIAWDHHAAMTMIVLKSWMASTPAIKTYLTQQIPMETLEHFLNTTKESLPSVLTQIESQLNLHEEGYQPLPQALIYNPQQAHCAADLVKCFKMALRINLDVPLPFMVYDPDQWYLHHSPAATSVTQATQIMLANIDTQIFSQFTLLAPDQTISLADLILTATIQPDLGLDMYNYTDSGTVFGKLYGFGTQPFGYTKNTFATQVLFHMSTYRDMPELFEMIPRLKEDYPEYRAILYFQLAQFAAQTHHPYWAATFLGWGLHYIQDITQPYHAVFANGLSTDDIYHAMSAIKQGDPQPLQHLIKLQSNRHLILEELSNYLLTATHKNPFHQLLLFNALGDQSHDIELQPCHVIPGYIRHDINKHIAQTASQYAVLLHETIPSSFIDDPNFSTENYQNYEALFYTKMNTTQQHAFTKQLAEALVWYGAYTRQCIKQYKIVS